jgi:sugar phosphate isomerase/epimerase
MSDCLPSRRTWLQTIPTALGAAALFSRSLLGQEYRIAGADIKLGVASYSFRKFSRTQAIQMLKELGTPYLNVKDFHLKLSSSLDEIDSAKREFKAAGVKLVGCGNVTFDKVDETDIRGKFEYAKRSGFPLIVCAPTAETLPLMEKYVKQYDIKIAIHNHGPEDKHFPTPQSVLAAVKDMDPRCGLCIDIGHTSRTGVNIVDSIAEAGPRLLDMHTKDLADPMVKESQVAVGEGKLPIKQIFAQLIKMKYNGSVNLEYEVREMDPLPGMKKSFAFMRSTLDELKADRA